MRQNGSVLQVASNARELQAMNDLEKPQDIFGTYFKTREEKQQELIDFIMTMGDLVAWIGQALLKILSTKRGSARPLSEAERHDQELARRVRKVNAIGGIALMIATYIMVWAVMCFEYPQAQAETKVLFEKPLQILAQLGFWRTAGATAIAISIVALFVVVWSERKTAADLRIANAHDEFRD